MVMHCECIPRYEDLVAKKHQDTSISLHPLSFEDAIEALSKSPKSEDSLPEASDSTTELAPESAPIKRKTSRRRKSSDG